MHWSTKLFGLLEKSFQEKVPLLEANFSPENSATLPLEMADEKNRFAAVPGFEKWHPQNFCSSRPLVEGRDLFMRGGQKCNFLECSLSSLDEICNERDSRGLKKRRKEKKQGEIYHSGQKKPSFVFFHFMPHMPFQFLASEQKEDPRRIQCQQVEHGTLEPRLKELSHAGKVAFQLWSSFSKVFPWVPKSPNKSRSSV